MTTGQPQGPHAGSPTAEGTTITIVSEPQAKVAAAHDVTRRRVTAAALVGGALALAVGRLLTLPGGTVAQRLTQASGHENQVAVETTLVVFGLLALMAGFLGVAARIRHRGAAMATIGAGLCMAGCALIVQVALDPVTVAATHVGNDQVMRVFLTELDQSPAIAVLTPIATIGYFFGPVLVTLAASRAGMVPRWLPWGMLLSLPLQFVGESLQGPPFANIADAALQLILVALVVVLARRTLLTD
ncbi:MAG: hypothetical protein ABI187_11775 [Ornithinibacter sp.]